MPSARLISVCTESTSPILEGNSNDRFEEVGVVDISVRELSRDSLVVLVDEVQGSVVAVVLDLGPPCVDLFVSEEPGARQHYARVVDGYVAEPDLIASLEFSNQFPDQARTDRFPKPLQKGAEHGFGLRINL